MVEFQGDTSNWEQAIHVLQALIVCLSIKGNVQYKPESIHINFADWKIATFLMFTWFQNSKDQEARHASAFPLVLFLEHLKCTGEI